jgi:urease accessory protein
MKTGSVYRLLQISDSAFPRGAFAHSLGLESYVHEGAVTDADSLAEFIENVLLESAAPLDGVYLREAWRFAEKEDLEGLMALDRDFSAARPVAPLRNASQSVGRQFLRTAVGYIEDDFLRRYESDVRAGASPGNYTLALGAVSRALGLSAEEGAVSLFYGTASGLVSAAVRLIPLGQTDGQRVMASLEGVVSRAAGEAMRRPIEEACAFGPGHEIRAMSHRRLHTRLFVS